MKKDSALGFIETVGLASSIAAADAALKAANVKLIGREISKGQGWVTIKITGDVAAVQAAVDAAKTAVAGVTPSMTNVIARPADGLGVMVRNVETTLVQDKTEEPLSSPSVEEQAPDEESALADAEESAELTEDVEAVEVEVENTSDATKPKNAGQHNKKRKK